MGTKTLFKSASFYIVGLLAECVYVFHNAMSSNNESASFFSCIPGIFLSLINSSRIAARD